jgi:hypothetical protein
MTTMQGIQTATIPIAIRRFALCHGTDSRLHKLQSKRTMSSIRSDAAFGSEAYSSSDSARLTPEFMCPGSSGVTSFWDVDACDGGLYPAILKG